MSGNASRAAVQELTRAYQELATKNAKNLTAAMQALAAVKSPAEFIELQQRLIKEGVEAAVSDSRHIAQLTTTVFTAAFEPVKKQIEAVQKTAKPGQSAMLFFESLEARPPFAQVATHLLLDVGPGETGLDRRAREVAEDILGPAIRRPRDLVFPGQVRPK